MSNINFDIRLESAFRYHSTLARALENSWLELFFQLEADPKVGVPEVMTLVHPRWHSELGISQLADPRGANSFNANFKNAKCRSEKIWGYICPYTDLNIHVDHSFPFARGGATTSENAMYLCSEHNLSKSTDIHLIPWEDLINQNWIGLQLKSIMKMAQRHTTENLYFPESAIKRI